MAQSASEIILAYNRDREPERLALKYRAMHKDVFKFLRGSCHLFYRRLTETKRAPGGPAAWICGDLHLENFGTYRAENGLIYFDINDFDEACLAPCSWDIVRLATSVLVAAPGLKAPLRAAPTLARQVVETYRRELLAGKARWIERRCARGVIGDLIGKLKKRGLKDLLEERTVESGGRRKLKMIADKTLPIAASDRTGLAALFKTLAPHAEGGKTPRFVDAARRIAGTGSLGIPRFVVLVEERPTPGSFVFIDLKAARASAVAPHSPVQQPEWRDDAERIIALQSRCQVDTPDLLRAVAFDRDRYVFRELQPSADKLNLDQVARDPAAFADAARQMGALAAWAQLRASGRGGAASADDLIAYAAGKGIVKEIIDAAQAMVASTRADWEQFRKTYKVGLISAATRGKPKAKRSAGKKKTPAQAGVSKASQPSRPA